MQKDLNQLQSLICNLTAFKQHKTLALGEIIRSTCALICVFDRFTSVESKSWGRFNYVRYL